MNVKPSPIAVGIMLDVLGPIGERRERGCQTTEDEDSTWRKLRRAWASGWLFPPPLQLDARN